MSNPDSNINAEEEPLSNPESNINVDEEPLHLFTPPRLRHPEYWQCIKLIAKSSLPDKATVMLSGQKYSTFVSAIPVLRKLESYLSN